MEGAHCFVVEGSDVSDGVLADVMEEPDLRLRLADGAPDSGERSSTDGSQGSEGSDCTSFEPLDERDLRLRFASGC